MTSDLSLYQPPETRPGEAEPQAGTRHLFARGLLAWGTTGVICGLALIPSAFIPAILEPLGAYRGAAIGGLTGVSLFFLKVHFYPMEEE